MQIKEVQEKLKISSYTLRYYEKMGLIQPYRDENGYRNYSEEDIHKIERIMFLSELQPLQKFPALVTLDTFQTLVSIDSIAHP